jgi:hypothetical protein
MSYCSPVVLKSISDLQPHLGCLKDAAMHCGMCYIVSLVSAFAAVVLCCVRVSLRVCCSIPVSLANDDLFSSPTEPCADTLKTSRTSFATSWLRQESGSCRVLRACLSVLQCKMLC